MANCLYWHGDRCENPKACTWAKNNGDCILGGQLRDMEPRARNKDLELLGIHYKKRITI